MSTKIWVLRLLQYCIVITIIHSIFIHEFLAYFERVYASRTALVARLVAKILHTRVSHRYVAATVSSRHV